MATEGPTLDHGMLVRQWSWPLRMVFWSMFIGVVLWGLTIGLHWVWALRAQPDGNKAPEAPKAETVPERSDAPVVESEPPPAPKAEPVPE